MRSNMIGVFSLCFFAVTIGLSTGCVEDDLFTEGSDPLEWDWEECEDDKDTPDGDQSDSHCGDDPGDSCYEEDPYCGDEPEDSCYEEDPYCGDQPEDPCYDDDDYYEDPCADLTNPECDFDCTDPQTWPVQWLDDMFEVVELTNQVRSSGTTCGNKQMSPVEPLELHLGIEDVAICHSEDMALNGFVDHTGTDGRDHADRVCDFVYHWEVVGENLANGETTPRQVVDAWLASPEDCETMMDPDYEDVGVGVVVHEGETYWTQTFATPREY